MAVTIAASSSTHFLWNGNPMPRVYRVAPHGAQDARLENVETGQFLIVLSDAVVAGLVRANQAALIAALSPLVSPAAGEGGPGGDVTVNVNEAAIGTAVNDAVRAGGPLPFSTSGRDNAATVRVTVGLSESQLAASRPGRSSIVMSAPISNTAPVSFGSSTPVSLTAHPQLNPGDSISLSTGSAFLGISTAAGQIVDVIEIY